MSFRQQILFWLIILAILTLLFGQEPGGLTESFYFVCLLLPVAIGTSWFFNDILVGKYLMARRYWEFGLYFVYSMIISLWAQMIVITLAFAVLARFHMDQLNPNIMNIRLLALTVYGIVFLQAFINMYRQFNYARSRTSELEKEQQIREKAFLMVKADRKQHRIEHDQILYIESLSDYVCFVLSDRENITTRETISRLEKRLPGNFVRIHRSFIVRKEAIESFTREEVRIGEFALPVGRKYKEAFIEEMDTPILPPSRGA